MTFSAIFRVESLRRRLGDIALWLLAAVPLVLATLLAVTLMSIAPAKAATDTVCSGKNVLDALKTSDPARYNATVEEGAKTLNGKSIFWKLEKPGIAPSYLLGTMHLTDPRVLTMPEGARKAQAATQTTLVESDEILDENKVAAALLKRPELTMITDGTTIASMLSPQDAERLEKGLQSRGIALTMVSRMQPWIISSFVSMPACEFARKGKGASFLDKKIAEDAVAAGHRLVGLETMEEQLKAMSGLPLTFHLQALIETLELGSRLDDATETMIQLYVAGDIGLIMPMLQGVAPEATSKEGGYADFEKRVVLDRNHVMAERAAPELARGNVFMAVGALHLPGEQGLVELFRKQGFTVTPAN